MKRKGRVFLIAAVTALVFIGLLFSGFSISLANATPVDGYNRYFGDLHTHTAYSDAWEGTPWDAFEVAIEAEADYMATTDHWSPWNAYKGLAIDYPEEWNDTLAAAEYYTTGEFVAMPGVEIWLLGSLGEINVYNSQELPLRKPLMNKHDRLPNFYDWLAEQDGAIGQFNHPTYMTKNFENYAYHTPKRDEAMTIIEVYNSVITEDSYIMALDAGWHLMPSANSDTHDPNWIAGYDERTVLLAEELTPEALYDAMRNRRGYGTLDKNLYILYTLDGEVMGSILENAADSLEAVIYIEDPDDELHITLVEIVSDGGEVVASQTGNQPTFNWQVDLDSADARYFYVRVTTTAGLTAWTAPVWTGN